MALINEASLEGIARACGKGDAAHTAWHLDEICRVCGVEIAFTELEETWRSLFDALNKRQFDDGNRRAILAFLRVALEPERYRDNPDDVRPCVNN